LAFIAADAALEAEALLAALAAFDAAFDAAFEADLAAWAAWAAPRAAARFIVLAADAPRDLDLLAERDLEAIYILFLEKNNFSK
jgi:hypothetical protein